MAVRLDESDEYMHELGPESNFNESMYINCFDPAQGVGGWFRMGNRANEGTAEMTVCLYLPAEVEGGKRSVGFMFKRPAIDNNDAFDAAGMKWTMVKPFEELRVDFVGKVVLLDEPEQMADPKAAFTNNPFDEAEVHLTFTGQGRPSMFGGEPDSRTRRPARSSPRATTSNSSPRPARSRSATREWDINGFGLRDHSWGPRYWQAPWYYRWLTANVDENFGFMASRVAKKDGPGSRGGFVWENGTMHLCDDVEITTETRGDEQYHDQIEGVLRSSRSDREWEFSGEVAQPDPAAQPPPGARRRMAADPDLRGVHGVDGQVRRVRRAGRLRHVGVPRPDHRRIAGRPRRVIPVPVWRMSEFLRRLRPDPSRRLALARTRLDADSSTRSKHAEIAHRIIHDRSAVGQVAVSPEGRPRGVRRRHQRCRRQHDTVTACGSTTPR